MGCCASVPDLTARLQPISVVVAHISTQDEKGCGDDQHCSQCQGNDVLGGGALQIELREDDESGDRRRHAARGQQTNEKPISVAYPRRCSVRKRVNY
jgi:hypothetical protein